MTTQIVNPEARTPTSGRGSGIVSGAAQGAAAGAQTGNVYGIIAGAVIGGFAGWLGGSKQDKSARYASLAYKYAKLRMERQAAITRRNIINEFRMARAKSMTMIGNEEGGTRSSSPQGSIFSLGAQFGFNISYFDADVYLQEQYQKFANKAKKQAVAANNINATLTSVAKAFGPMAGGFSTSSAPSSSSTGSTGTSSGSGGFTWGQGPSG